MTSASRAIFRAYDIRGVVDRDFDETWVERLGRAMGALFIEEGHAAAVVGHDTRHSSPRYAERLTRGLAAMGVDVIQIGMTPTPVFYFAVKHLGKHAGCIITASHNPPEYNGFKIWSGEGTIHTTQIQRLYELMAATSDAPAAGGALTTSQGLVSHHDIVPAYLETLTAALPDPDVLRNLTVVVDGGNGAGGLVTTALLERAGATVVPLYCEPDGDFPNHHPDPVVAKNLVDLQTKVHETGADFGVGLDGDGDRIGVVDETGAMLYGDQLLAIFARDMLQRRPGATVIGEVKCSHLLYKDIAAHGGVPLMWKTGHSVLKAKLKETGALLAGEMSGHMFFAEDYHGFDDASLAALRLAMIVGRAKRAGGPPLSAMLADWPATANTPEIRMECPDAIKFQVVQLAAEHFRANPDNLPCELVDVDGVRLNFADGWALVRASNTQPALVLRFEAETPERLAELRALVEVPLQTWIAEAARRR